MQWQYWFGAVFASVGSGVLSSIEVALTHFCRSRLLERLSGERLRFFEEELQKQDRFVLMVRTLDTIADIVCILLVVVAIADGEVLLWKALIYGLALVLVVGETAPSALGRLRAEWIVERFLPVLSALDRVLKPFVVVVAWVNGLFARLWGAIEEKEPEDDIAEEILSVVSEGEQQGALQEEQREMIENIIELPDVTVADIMTPRTDMVFVESDARIREITKVALAQGFSRLPVCEGSHGNVIGVLYVKDLLKHSPDQELVARDIMRPALYVPETEKVSELLRDLRAARVHIAIVIDEYGVAVGLVTLEDIIEEIVGDVADEYDTMQRRLVKTADGQYEVDAGMNIEEFNRETGFTLPESDLYESVGGFLLSELGRIPRDTESFEYDNLRFTILEADQRRIKRVQVQVTHCPVRSS